MPGYTNLILNLEGMSARPLSLEKGASVQHRILCTGGRIASKICAAVVRGEGEDRGERRRMRMRARGGKKEAERGSARRDRQAGWQVAGNHNVYLNG